MKYFVFSLFIAFLLFQSMVKGENSLVGSRSSLYKQNERAEKDGLPSIRDDEDLDALKKYGVLVEIPAIVKIDSRLEKKWRWCLLQTSYFINDLGFEFRKVFGKYLQVNSAVRTVERQLEIMQGNNNAVPVVGPRRSSHLTGATVDIAKIGLTKPELEWVRLKLLALEKADILEATEENDQAVFHIMVFQSYTWAKTSELWGQ